MIEARLEDAIILEATERAEKIEEVLHREFESYRSPYPLGNGKHEWFCSEIKPLVISYLEIHKEELGWHRMYILNEKTPKRRGRPDKCDQARARNAQLFADYVTAVQNRNSDKILSSRSDQA